MQVQGSQGDKMKWLFGVLLLSLSNIASAWVWNADFECGADGEHIGTATGCGIANRSLTFGSDDVAYNSDISLSPAIVSGSTGDNEFGAVFLFGHEDVPNGRNLVQGDELWYRIWYYFPAGFDFTASGSGLKLTRVKTVDSGGGHEAFISSHIQGNLSMGNAINHAAFTENNGSSSNAGDTVTTGNWMAVERYHKFHSTPGQGIYRVYQNGNLIFEDLLTETLTTSSSEVSAVYIFTYWNGGAPQSQHCYIDEIILTSETPSDTDEDDNPFIGVGDFVPPDPESPRGSGVNVGENTGQNIGIQLYENPSELIWP